MHTFQKKDKTVLTMNPFDKIGKQWMLITSGDEDKANTMTASWGGVGVLWGSDVVYIFVRQSRYTKEFIDKTGHFSISFLGEEYRKALQHLGTVSGRDGDKISEAGVSVAYENGIPYIDEGIEMLKSLGYEVEILDITKFDETYLKDKFLKTECICISGGNTFYLLQEIKRKNLVEVLFKRIKEGLFYIGESAGAIIMSENIEYSQMMDDKSIASELDDYTGVNVFDHYVLPHIGEYPFEESTQKILENYQDKISLVAINNSEAILVNDSGYTIYNESC